MSSQSFDWSDFLKLADELAVRPEEYCLRTSISRAYYYAYHLAKKRIADNEFPLIRGGDTHKQVWEKFELSPDFECRKLYNIAKRLKDKRQQADYEAVFPRIEEEASAILQQTRQFANQLKALNVRLPANTGFKN